MLGRHRSGTTWVTNLIAAHPKVYTPEHQVHQGQKESAFFSSLVPYCRNGFLETDRRAIGAIFERSDYWYLLFPENPPVLDIEKLGVAGYFSRAMDEAARRRGCTHWVEKTPAHSLFLGDLLRWFPKAKFIAVQRSRLETVRSNVYKSGNPKRMRDWFKAAMWGEIYAKAIRLNRRNVCLVKYEALLEDFASESKRISAYIGLGDTASLMSRWAPDSSYDGVPPIVPIRFRVIIWIVRCLFYLIPARFGMLAGRLWFVMRGGVLPRGFFLLYRGMGRSKIE